jgi:hypothetical protein
LKKKKEYDEMVKQRDIAADLNNELIKHKTNKNDSINDINTAITNSLTFYANYNNDINVYYNTQLKPLINKFDDLKNEIDIEYIKQINAFIDELVIESTKEKDNLKLIDNVIDEIFATNGLTSLAHQKTQLNDNNTNFEQDLKIIKENASFSDEDKYDKITTLLDITYKDNQAKNVIDVITDYINDNNVVVNKTNKLTEQIGKLTDKLTFINKFRSKLNPINIPFFDAGIVLIEQNMQKISDHITKIKNLVNISTTELIPISDNFEDIKLDVRKEQLQLSTKIGKILEKILNIKNYIDQECKNIKDNKVINDNKEINDIFKKINDYKTAEVDANNYINKIKTYPNLVDQKNEFNTLMNDVNVFIIQAKKDINEINNNFDKQIIDKANNIIVDLKNKKKEAIDKHNDSTNVQTAISQKMLDDINTEITDAENTIKNDYPKKKNELIKIMEGMIKNLNDVIIVKITNIISDIDTKLAPSTSPAPSASPTPPTPPATPEELTLQTTIQAIINFDETKVALPVINFFHKYFHLENGQFRLKRQMTGGTKKVGGNTKINALLFNDYPKCAYNTKIFLTKQHYLKADKTDYFKDIANEVYNKYVGNQYDLPFESDKLWIDFLAFNTVLNKLKPGQIRESKVKIYDYVKPMDQILMTGGFNIPEEIAILLKERDCNTKVYSQIIEDILRPYMKYMSNEQNILLERKLNKFYLLEIELCDYMKRNIDQFSPELIKEQPWIFKKIMEFVKLLMKFGKLLAVLKKKFGNKIKSKN